MITLSEEEFRGTLEMLVPQHLRYKNYNFSEVARQMKRKRLLRMELAALQKVMDAQREGARRNERVSKSVMEVFDRFHGKVVLQDAMGLEARMDLRQQKRLQ